MANDISSLTIQGTTYPIKDPTARTNAQTAITTANTANTTASQAQQTANTANTTASQAQQTASQALSKVNNLELQGSLSGEVLTLSIGSGS